MDNGIYSYSYQYFANYSEIYAFANNVNNTETSTGLSSVFARENM